MPIASDHHVLFVDDEQDSLFAIKRFLRSEDYTTHFARSAEEAFEQCEEYNISVVVSDLRMPGTSGLELIESLQARYPEMIRIILSGTEDIGMIIETINSGRIFRFIPKPVEAERLKIIMRDAIAIHTLQTEHREMKALSEKQNRYLTRINDELSQATARLRNSELRFRAINDAAFDPIFLINRNGSIAYANSAAESTFGFTKSEFHSMHFGSLLAQEEVDEGIEVDLLNASANTLKEKDARFIAKDGRTIDVAISTGTVDIQTIPHIVMIARDNTLRIQAERSRQQLEKMQHTLESQIERKLMQSHTPKGLDGAKISNFMLSSGYLNGDFADFIAYDNRHIDIMTGDVMGHGILSALVGSGLKSLYLRTLARKSLQRTLPELKEVVSEFHQGCIKDLLEIEIYATMLFFRLDLEKKTLSLIDCGHTPSLHINARSGTSSCIKGTNLPVGMVEQQTFETVTVPVEAGDIIVIYSDGITEAQLPDGSMFGEERLADLVFRHRHMSSDDLLALICRELGAATGSETFEDDASCIVIRIDDIHE
ncbi:SpoIIE family protein phosphatase [Chlorobium sp. N1]|uniref:SpoIIE family protein phosphatase n=1 Tax=Chlorobium sp. N1 TaxID=2491138 RepID=UPI0010387FB7|nr:SpoIIE family protein phosphatase [Chlorobium sp. N1]TCD48538.1 response regulator [Chlorobium sp. N1]